MSCFNFSWHNFAIGWLFFFFFLQFSAKLFALTALSLFSNSIETVKTVSFGL